MLDSSSVHIFPDSDRLISECSRDLNDYLGSIANTLDRPPRLVLTGGRLGQALVSSLAAQNSA
ncbi:MAG: hypothetical protein RL198_979, partial [Actinomycetota bacterium]